jgi:hypothetical protein
MPLGKHMSQYEHSLTAMKHLLDAVGDHWADWIGADIERWRSNRDTSHHLRAYGGMGSFNDIVICRANQHRITESRAPWANILFKWLKAICCFLAQHPNDSFTADALSNAVGMHNPSLSAFVGGNEAPSSMRGYANEDPKLQGWRCLDCGCSEASNRDIEYLLAQVVVPSMIFRSCEFLTLVQLVDRILECSINGIDNMRKEIVAAVTASDISLKNREGWMRPCPSCGRDATAVYRWRLITDKGFRFEPAADNLPLRK